MLHVPVLTSAHRSHPLRLLCLAMLLTAWTAAVTAQVPLTNPKSGSASSSSSSSVDPEPQQPSSSAPSRPPADANNPENRPQAARITPGGAAVTLEYNEPLFQMAVGLNACGYDRDLQDSAPVRTAVREDLNAVLAGSEEARTARDALCQYIAGHRLNDSALDIGQYISLALYLSPPPELTTNVDESDLPPQATPVVNVLPRLRAFSEAAQLHLLFLRHRAAYEAVIQQVKPAMTHMLFETNSYLHQPISNYDNRRFLVLLEPMLSPALTNARIYGSDYIIVMSPDNRAEGEPVRMDAIRHIYLHYLIEPLVYSRGSAMERIQPLLRGVSDAPLEFYYKSDVVALITECMIKAIEAHLLVIDQPRPTRPPANRSRAEAEQYDAQLAAYDSLTNVARDALVATDERQGWVLTGYFYRTFSMMQHEGGSLADTIAPMIYTMDVDRERKHAETILFDKESSVDPLGRSAPVRTAKKAEPLDEADRLLASGDLDGAQAIAEKTLADPHGNHGRAQYTLAQLDLLHGDPTKALAGFQQTLKITDDPRTIAWAHIYLGRLYDVQPDRERALAEYKLALQHRDGLPDTRQAAEAGLKKPFALPRREQAPPSEEDLDPTGKAQKEAYRPDATPSSTPH